MARKINYDRGVMKQFDGATGIAVYMYLDQPGVFLSSQGTPVAIELARRAGFEVDNLLKKKLLAERIASAMVNIKAELEMGEKEQKVLEERDGFKLVDIGVGRHQILGPDGDSLIPAPLPLEEAKLLFVQLAPLPEPSVPAVPEVKKPVGKRT